MPIKKRANRTEELRSKLDERGLHMTRQRAVVFEYLSRLEGHPTAEEVFLAVKQKLPRVSLATVYKNLEALIEIGLASKLSYGDSAARYDIRTDHHYHTRCERCGKIEDLDPGEASAWLKRIKPHPGFEVTDFRLEVAGYCSGCRT